MTDSLTLAKALMACPSLTPHDAGCQDIMREVLNRNHFTCESMRFDEVDNLWARHGTISPLFVFAGHTDVVPTGPLTDWQTDPFAPTIRDGFLFGRGASDMKAALACMVIAAETFVQKHPTFAGSIAFLVTSDEEGPSIDGTKRVIAELIKRGEKIDYCLIGEPSSDKIVGDQIRIGRRGSLHGHVIFNGKQGHVAHPHLAINPIHHALLALHEFAHTTWDNGNNDFPPTTLQLTNIHGGTGAQNVVPGHLEIMFNFRFSTAITVDELKARTEKIFANANVPFDLTWQIGAEPFLIKRGKLLTATEKSIQSVMNFSPRLSTGGGTSDGRFIAPTGAEVIELGLLNATAHHVNENVAANDLTLLTQMYLRILENVFLSS